jgi:Bifunctional DNA primase/polymerase, N-terminal
MSAATIAMALDYATRRGWPIFPCSTTKVPLVREWGRVATTDSVQISAWLRRWPDALIAMPTGVRPGLVVLDIDVKAGRNGFDTLGEFGLAILPDTPLVHTRSGGVHVYFARHPRVEIRNSEGAKGGLGVGLDVRGDGGLVILPTPASGYWWDPHWNFDTVAPYPAPAWLGHKNKPKTVELRSGKQFNPHRALHESCNLIRSAPDGEKHSILNCEAFRVATLVASRLLDRDDAWRDLQAATAALIATSNADPHKTWKFLDVAFRDGLNAPRRASR